MRSTARYGLLVALPLLGACAADGSDEVPPEEDGVLTCGGTESLDGLTTGDEIHVTGTAGGSLIFTVDVGEVAGHGLRLRAEASSAWRRVTEIWDAGGTRRLIPASSRPGEDLWLEVLVPPDEQLSGSVTLTCPDPPEVCFDLTDNDGDGLVDCADLACARDESCAQSQQDFQPVQPECSADFVDLELDVLDRLSDQRTLYRSQPAGEGAPWQTFHGGGEIVLLPPLDPGSVTARVGGAGFLCLGAVQGDEIVCDSVQPLADGDEITLDPGQLPAWFEPEDPNWTSFALRVDCATE